MSNIVVQTSRFRPSKPVCFQNPIRGKSGAELHAYEWKWRLEDIVDARGEDRTKRVSDWDRAQASGETGRELVHQFTVKMRDGDLVVVSSEGVLRLLGFTSSKEAGSVSTVVSLVKRVARLQLALAIEEEKHNEADRIYAAVNLLPVPPVENLGKAYPSSPGSRSIKLRMGDAVIYQIGGTEPEKERIECLTSVWRGNRARDLGLVGDSYGMPVSELRLKIKKLMRKIDLLSAGNPAAPAQRPILES